MECVLCVLFAGVEFKFVFSGRLYKGGGQCACCVYGTSLRVVRGLVQGGV